MSEKPPGCEPGGSSGSPRGPGPIQCDSACRWGCRGLRCMTPGGSWPDRSSGAWGQADATWGKHALPLASLATQT